MFSHQVILPDGRLVAMGGYSTLPTNTLSSTEVYSVSTATWNIKGNMTTPRESFAIN